ncbi:DUF5667 domain-containing protein [Nocardioides sp.]|uniref:DUF5667 domain-containing protein n=1 Tax=Nocardioides sp. TaxID=35761 RepID=UPI0026196F60|nr:DUF5667 domain-containing protein [Nocardioides sp.]
MNTSPFGKNAAEQFDDLLEGRIDDAPEELTRLLGFAEQVWALPEPQPRPDFTAALRARLMEEAPAAMAEGASDHRLSLTPIASTGSAKRRRRLAALVAVVSIGAAATGTAFAAEDSLPGETLYPVKRLVESAHTAISVGDSSKGSTELGQATTRLQEATALAKAGQTERATETLQDFVTSANKGAELLTSAGKGEAIHDFTATSVTDLGTLTGLLPTDVITPVLTVVLSIDQAVKQTFPDAGSGITTLPGSLVQMLTAILPPTATKTPGPTTVLAPSATATPKSGSTKGAASLPQTPTPATPKSTSTPKAAPSSLGEVVGSVGNTVGNGVVGGLGGALSSTGASVGGPVGGLVSGVGDTVTGVGGLVSDLLNGVGGLLNPSITPTK